MQQLFLLAAALVATIAQANIGPQGFRVFLNPYFVETGTFVGRLSRILTRQAQPRNTE